MSSGLRRGHFHVLGLLVIDFSSLKCILCTSHVWLLPKRVSEDEVRRRIHHCTSKDYFNPLNAELNAICYLLALLGAHPILHVSRIRVKTTSFQRELNSGIWN